MLASLFTGGVWIVGHLTRDLRDIGADAESRARAARHLRCCTACCPTSRLQPRRSEAAHRLPVTRLGLVCCRCSTARATSTLVLFAAVAVFERRDFR